MGLRGLCFAGRSRSMSAMPTATQPSPRPQKMLARRARGRRGRSAPAASRDTPPSRVPRVRGTSHSPVARYACELQRRDHVHVVDPPARLVGETVGQRVVPLRIGEGQAHHAITETRAPACTARAATRRTRPIDMIGARHVQRAIGGQERIEACHQTFAQIFVLRHAARTAARPSRWPRARSAARGCRGWSSPCAASG